jgi:hypothetical protein
MQQWLTARRLCINSFYSHWLNLMQDDQENKQVTNVVPNVRFPGRPGWLLFVQATTMIAPTLPQAHTVALVRCGHS